MLITIVLMLQYKANEEEQGVPADIHIILQIIGMCKPINRIATSHIK